MSTSIVAIGVRSVLLHRAKSPLVCQLSYRPWPGVMPIAPGFQLRPSYMPQFEAIRSRTKGVPLWDPLRNVRYF